MFRYTSQSIAFATDPKGLLVERFRRLSHSQNIVCFMVTSSPKSSVFGLNVRSSLHHGS